jgi:hypothetical protein
VLQYAASLGGVSQFGRGMRLCVPRSQEQEHSHSRWSGVRAPWGQGLAGPGTVLREAKTGHRQMWNVGRHEEEKGGLQEARSGEAPVI